MALEHNSQNTPVKEACRQLRLDEAKYGDTFEQIARDWEQQLGDAGYLAVFVTPAILKICREPADFLRASQIVLEATKAIWGDGSNGFWRVLNQAIDEGKVTSLNGLQVLCTQLVASNHDFKKSEDGSDPLKHTGKQFQRFLAEINPQL